MAQAALRSTPGGADHEARLARAAASGNGRAFATLLARYEERVFNLALRIAGSPELAARAVREAFLDVLRAPPHLKGGESFGSDLFTATRDAALDLVEQESAGHGPPAERAAPPDGPLEEDPELQLWQDEIRDAASRLPANARELLALGGMEELSYDEIAPIVDADPGSIPELMARTRLELHDELFGADLAGGEALPPDCEQALPLIAMRDDGQLDDEEDFGWLLDHLAHCAGCRLRLDGMEEASAAYREWPPVPAPPTLLRETMSAAADLTGADWSDLADEWGVTRSSGLVRARYGGAHASVKGMAAGLAPAVSGASEAATEAIGSLRESASGLASQAWRRRPPRDRAVTAGLLAVVLLGLTAIAAGAALVLKGDDEPSPAAAPRTAESAPYRGPTFSTPSEPRPARPAASPEKRKPRRKKAAATPVPEAKRAKPEKAPDRPRRRSVPRAVAVPLPEQTPQAPTPTPPAQPAPQTPQPAPTGCKDPAGNAIPCP